MQKYCAAEFTKFSSVFEHLLSVPPNLQGIIHKRKEIARGKCFYTSYRQSDKMDVQISRGIQIHEKCCMVCLPYSPISHRP